MNVLEHQRALGVRADGDYGPVTRAAADAALTCPDPRPLVEADFLAAAARLRCPVPAVKAVVAVESGRLGGFDRNTRRPIILFEPHVFSRETGGDFDGSHPLISYAGWGKRPYPRTQAERWAQLHQAMALDPGAALSSASWGAFQVMGFNHRACGFGTVWAFARAIASGPRAQLDAAVNYILHRRLDDELREGRWAAFALAWNGPGFAKHDYDGRLAAENRKALAA